MKKFMAALLAFAAVILFAGCGGKTEKEKLRPCLRFLSGGRGCRKPPMFPTAPSV